MVRMRRTFLREWMWRSTRLSITRGDLAASVAGNALTVAVQFVPTWRTTLNDLAWQIPVYGLVGVFLWRLALAPYDMWKDQKDRADSAEDVAQSLRQGASKPAFRLDIVQTAVNIELGDTGYNTVFVVLSVANIGSIASALNWKMELITASNRLPLDNLHVPGFSSSSGGVNVRYLENDAIYGKTRTPLIPGQEEHGWLMSGSKLQEVGHLDKGDTIIVTCSDVFGNNYESTVSVGEYSDIPRKNRFYPGMANPFLSDEDGR